MLRMSATAPTCLKNRRCSSPPTCSRHGRGSSRTCPRSQRLHHNCTPFLHEPIWLLLIDVGYENYTSEHPEMLGDMFSDKDPNFLDTLTNQTPNLLKVHVETPSFLRSEVIGHIFCVLRLAESALYLDLYFGIFPILGQRCPIMFITGYFVLPLRVAVWLRQ